MATVAFYPGIINAELPSDALLAAMDRPRFRALFQAMIFSALLQSGVSAVHAFNERVDGAWRRGRGEPLGSGARAGISLVLLGGCMFLADRFGLVALIGSGYRFFAYVLLAVFVLPLCTVGVRRILSSARSPHPAGAHDVPATS